MNLIHRSIWNDQTGTFVAVSENTRTGGKRVSSCKAASSPGGSFNLKMLALSLLMACGASAYAQPAGGVVSAGGATIGGTAANMTITQTTPTVAINWQSFGIQAGESVRFVQPGSSSVALNRVIGADPSNILGSLTANGKVFLVNPNGILFGQGASVNVGGLVASTLAITDASFMANQYKFGDAGPGSVVNEGTLSAAAGGYVALLGARVSNQGTIAAQLGTVALAAGNAATLDMAGDRLLSVTVNQGAMDALADNGGMLRADGGFVLMTTQAAGSVLSNAVNNTGMIQAQTIQNVSGTIMLMGGMHTGTVHANGTLDASAPHGGNGGFIETSAARVKIADSVKITTEALQGNTGTWLIDPEDFTIGSLVTDNISGVTLSNMLVTNSVVIRTAPGTDATGGTPPVTDLYTSTPGNGDIHVNDAISWSASSDPTTLSLLASGDVNINSSITAVKGNLNVCCGRDVNVKLGAAITTTNGSVLLAAGRDVNLLGALTTNNGNVTICAANDVNIGAKITLTHTTSIIAEQSLGLPLGLVLSAGYGAGGPGPGGGTVIFKPLAPAATVTNAPTTINYNPVAYTVPTDYSGHVIGAAPVQHMLVFAQGVDKAADGTTAAIVTSLKGAPAGDVTLVAGPGSTATFDTPGAGTDKTVTMTGYSLGGADASLYALASSCCGPVVSTTTANITAVIPPVVIPPVVVPPVVVPPVVVPPVVTSPGVTPPVVIAPGVTPPVIAPATGPAVGNSAVLPVLPALTPHDAPAPVGPGYALTVLPPAPMQPVVLAIALPPAPMAAPTIAPVIAPPQPYIAPVRKPRVERN